jgi:uncharacterized protein YajQ (UPF0234 family)
MPSFDVVSELNRQEVANAVNQTNKEILTRFDFKNAKAVVALEEDGLHLSTIDEHKMQALLDIFKTKAIKRGVSLKSLDYGKIESGLGGTAKCLVKLIDGIETEKARELVKLIKGMNLKVQAAIEGNKLRVSGKNRDDLQTAIQKLRAADFSLDLQFNNFRD